MKKLLLHFLLLFFTVSFLSCEREEKNSEEFELKLPKGFPAPKIPEDNPLTTKKVELGRMLFFDPTLSRDSSISCSSCHLPEFAFSDNKQFSIGIHGQLGDRNAPSLANVAYAFPLLRDGGKKTLEAQIINPIEAEDEMGFNILELLERLKNDENYPRLFQEAFNREIDLFGLSRALAAFQRTLISGNSRFDQFHFQRKKGVLSEPEKLGMRLFFSEKTNCSGCHSGFNFSNNQFENNGLYEEFADVGRAGISFNDNDVGKFRVPTLRNVELTAPYMHDGSLNSLEDVLAHYNLGGKGHHNQSVRIAPLNLTKEETTAIIAFLKTLTDTSFLDRSAFQHH